MNQPKIEPRWLNYRGVRFRVHEERGQMATLRVVEVHPSDVPDQFEKPVPLFLNEKSLIARFKKEVDSWPGLEEQGLPCMCCRRMGCDGSCAR